MPKKYQRRGPPWPKKARRGEQNGFSKLTSQQVINIFYDKRPQSEIAGDYGIAQVTVSSIKTRRNWRWLLSA
jgi:hypothetical protein